MSKVLKQILALVILMFGYLPTAATDPLIELSSGNTQVALIELFTSEGCSSCPPADQWLTELKTHPDLWKEFTPIAFHVDYWDYIGWQDEFAQAEFGVRQRRYAAEGGARFVYTPGFFLKGSEWQGWRSRESIPRSNIEVGELSLRISGDQVSARFDARQDIHERLILHVAVLGMNIETRVQAGENRGKVLHHDFVTLDVKSVQLDRADTAYATTLQLPELWSNPGESAIVAWVSEGNRQTPVQSVGGFIPGG